MKRFLAAMLAMFLTVAGICTYMFCLAHRNRIIQHTITKGNTSSSRKLTIFFISDIHRRRLPLRLLQKLKGFPLDAVIIGGDLAEKGVPLGRVQRNVQLLAELGPLYYVFGNNDQEIGTEPIVQTIENAGGIVLADATAGIPGHPSWSICGLEDPANGNVDIEKAVNSAAGAEHLILVVHNPSLFKKIEHRLDADLLLAGHTHGGQIRFFDWGLQDLGSFQQTGGKAKLISNGYGTTMVPLRLGAKPECHIIEIHYSA